MASWQSHALRPLMRLAGLSMGRLARRDPAQIATSIQSTSALSRRMSRVPRGAVIERTEVGGVPGTWARPAVATSDSAILYLHGGGIMTPVAGPFEMVSSWLAIFSGMAVFCPDYRLQPGHVYPAAHEDCWTVYRELEQSGTLAGLVGDSSGGVLALAMMLRARAAGLGLPALCVLLSPTVDYGFTDQGIWDAQDVFGNPTLFKKMHQGYVAGADLRCADLTPIQENLAGLPQLEVFVGEAEILRKESDRLVEALEGVGRLNLHPAVGMWHGWYVMADVLPEGRATLRQAAESIAAAAKEKRGPARRSPS